MPSCRYLSPYFVNHVLISAMAYSFSLVATGAGGGSFLSWMPTVSCVNKGKSSVRRSRKCFERSKNCSVSCTHEYRIYELLVLDAHIMSKLYFFTWACFFLNCAMINSNATWTKVSDRLHMDFRFFFFFCNMPCYFFLKRVKGTFHFTFNFCASSTHSPVSVKSLISRPMFSLTSTSIRKGGFIVYKKKKERKKKRKVSAVFIYTHICSTCTCFFYFSNSNPWYTFSYTVNTIPPEKINRVNRGVVPFHSEKMPFCLTTCTRQSNEFL